MSKASRSNKTRAGNRTTAAPATEPVSPPGRQGGGWRRFLIPLLLFLAGYASFNIPASWFN